MRSMRISLSVAGVIVILGCFAYVHTRSESAATLISIPGALILRAEGYVATNRLGASGYGANVLKVDFETQIRPILESRCKPCHFSGGKVYERLPFDRSETIKKLGNRLFTRIKDENERRLIREFLEQE